jgi:cysteine desulfurase/selenocysteine lyase
MAAQSPVKAITGIEKFRADFPVLKTKMNGQPLAFLDTAASAQKPQAVLDAMNAVYEGAYANIHRGLYRLSTDLTEKFENVRARVAKFIGATEREIVFTRNATEGVNLVAMSWGHRNLRQGDEIILTEMEHHANIVPWQILRDHIGIVIKTVPFDATGTCSTSTPSKNFYPQRRSLSALCISRMRSALSIRSKHIIRMVRGYNKDIHILSTVRKRIVHGPVNMRDLDADFYVFTGHKLYGPTGIGVLYGKFDVLNAMPPYQGGGDMIARVSFEKTTYKDAPYRFEAGTPAIAEVIGLGAAIDYMQSIGMDKIAAHEQDLLGHATEQLKQIDGLTIHGTAPEKAGILSFTMKNIHPSPISAWCSTSAASPYAPGIIAACR